MWEQAWFWFFGSQAKKAIFMIKNQFTLIFFGKSTLFGGYMIGAKYTECHRIWFYLRLPQNQVISGEVTSQEKFLSCDLVISWLDDSKQSNKHYIGL